MAVKSYYLELVDFNNLLVRYHGGAPIQRSIVANRISIGYQCLVFKFH
jgi:hypothetical protein